LLTHTDGISVPPRTDPFFVAEVVARGFPAEEAAQILERNNNNLQDAFSQLVRSRASGSF